MQNLNTNYQEGWYKHYFNYDINNKYHKFLKQPFYQSDCQLQNDFITYMENNFPIKANKSKSKFILNNDKINKEGLTAEEIYLQIDEINNFITAYNQILKGDYNKSMAKMTSDCWKLFDQYKQETEGKMDKYKKALIKLGINPDELE